jgi:hypothetical protein
MSGISGPPELLRFPPATPLFVFAGTPLFTPLFIPLFTPWFLAFSFTVGNGWSRLLWSYNKFWGRVGDNLDTDTPDTEGWWESLTPLVIVAVFMPVNLLTFVAFVTPRAALTPLTAFFITAPCALDGCAKENIATTRKILHNIRLISNLFFSSSFLLPIAKVNISIHLLPFFTILQPYRTRNSIKMLQGCNSLGLDTDFNFGHILIFFIHA